MRPVFSVKRTLRIVRRRISLQIVRTRPWESHTSVLRHPAPFFCRFAGVFLDKSRGGCSRTCNLGCSCSLLNVCQFRMPFELLEHWRWQVSRSHLPTIEEKAKLAWGGVGPTERIDASCRGDGHRPPTLDLRLSVAWMSSTSKKLLNSYSHPGLIVKPKMSNTANFRYIAFLQ